MADEEQKTENGEKPPTTAVATTAPAPAVKPPLLIGAAGLVPTDVESLWRMATIIANSDLAPKDYSGKPGNAAVAIQLGMELGMKPMAAIQNIAVINGRPAIWGQGMVGLVKASGLLALLEETYEGTPYEKNYTAICRIQRRGESVKTYTFSVDDAEKAGLWKKGGPWTNYPKRMLMWRAKGFACNDTFPDVLKGLVMMAEEAIDITPVGEDARPVRPTVTVESILAAEATSQPQGDPPAEVKAEPAPVVEEEKAAPVEAKPTPVVEPKTEPPVEKKPDPRPPVRAVLKEDLFS